MISTRRFFLVGLLFGLFAGGCGPTTNGSEDTVARVAIAPPDFSRLPLLGLKIGGDVLRLGEARARFIQATNRPEDSVLSQELPVVLRNSDFTAQSWQRGYRGAGAIFYNERVALAMETAELAYDTDFKSAVAAYQDELNKLKEESGVPVTGFPADARYTTYRIWDVSGQRVFLLLFRQPNGKYRMTAAVGFADLMTALGFTRDAAERGGPAIEAMLDPLTGGQGDVESMPSATPSTEPTPTPSTVFPPR